MYVTSLLLQSLVIDCTCYLIVVFSEFNVQLSKRVTRTELVCIMSVVNYNCGIICKIITIFTHVMILYYVLALNGLSLLQRWWFFITCLKYF